MRLHGVLWDSLPYAYKMEENVFIDVWKQNVFFCNYKCAEGRLTE
jgi:hypothetical protein